MNALAESPALPAFVHGEAPIEAEGRFFIDDERKAAWASGKILAARHRIVVRTRLAEDYQTRILQWLTTVNQGDLESIGFLELALRPWVEDQLASQPRSRTLRLPGAKVGLRKRPDRVEVLNSDQVLSFCIEHQLEDAVVIKHELSKTGLKRHLLEGAQIPGAQLVPGSDELTVSED